jgi:hypothetical protein
MESEEEEEWVLDAAREVQDRSKDDQIRGDLARENPSNSPL